MRRIIKSLFLIFLGVAIGFIAYEAIMFIRVSRLRSENPVTTSLIEARVEYRMSAVDDANRCLVATSSRLCFFAWALALATLFNKSMARSNKNGEYACC